MDKEAIITLINPIRGGLPPIGLLHLGAVLERQGHRVKIVELLEYKENEYIEKNVAPINNIIKGNPTFIGISCLTATRDETRLLTQYFKEKAPHIPIVLGGRHPTQKTEDTLKWGADYVVIGEGEDTIIELTKHILFKAPKLKDIGGVAYKENGHISFERIRPKRVDLATLPFLSYHLVDYNAYVNMKFNSIRGKYVRGGFIFTGRGCIGRCTFCFTEEIQRKIRYRPIPNVLAEIQHQIEKYNLDAMYILDDTFTMSERRVVEFTKELRNRKIKTLLACLARADTFTENMAKHLQGAGFVQVEFGVESGSQKVLDALKKGITVDQIENAFAISKKYGLSTLANILIGSPTESAEDIEMTKRLLHKIQPDTTVVSFITPFPGTALFEQAKRNGWIKDEEAIDYKQMGAEPSLCINFTKDELKKLRNGLYASTLARSSLDMLKNSDFIIDMTKLTIKKPRFPLDFLACIIRGKSGDAVNLFKNELINSAFKG